MKFAEVLEFRPAVRLVGRVESVLGGCTESSGIFERWDPMDLVAEGEGGRVYVRTFYSPFGCICPVCGSMMHRCEAVVRAATRAKLNELLGDKEVDEQATQERTDGALFLMG